MPPFLKWDVQKNLKFEIFRENYWKEVVSDLKTFTNKGCKIAAQKKVGFGANFALLSRIFWYWCFSLRLMVFLPPFLKSNVQTFEIIPKLRARHKYQLSSGTQFVYVWLLGLV